MKSLAALIFLTSAVYAEGNLPVVPASVMTENVPAPLNRNEVPTGKSNATYNDQGFRVELIDATWSQFIETVNAYLTTPLTFDSELLSGKKLTFVASFPSPDVLDAKLGHFVEAHGLVMVERNGIRSIVPVDFARTSLLPVVRTLELSSITPDSVLPLLTSAFPDATFSTSLGQQTITYRAPVYDERAIISMISRLDISQRQVLVEAVIFESTLSDLERIGVKTGVSLGDLQILSDPIAAAGTFVGSVVGNSGFATLELLQQSSSYVLHSRPTLSLLSGFEGSILVGKDIPIITGSVRQEDGEIYQSIERRSVGVSLKVTPHILKDKVRLTISQDVSSVSSSIDSQFSDVVIDTRQLSTMAEVEDGAILYLGGLMSGTQEGVVSGVPVLSSLPWIGGLFTYRSSRSSDQSLSLLLRVKII